ncbi:MAG: biopolymer transporter ExbD [Bdellovibrionia bacterium]
MPIYAPGKRNRHNKAGKKHGRKVVANLSLTAMVDMFTVLTVFLLQNYNATGQVIHIPKEVVLPKASEVKELAPARVVTISSKELLIDDKKITDFQTVKDIQGWVIPVLRDRLKQILAEDKVKAEKDLTGQLRNIVRGKKKEGEKEEKVDRPWTRVTVQADKEMEIGILKKVMATVMEAGVAEINFAVAKKPTNPDGVAN